MAEGEPWAALQLQDVRRSGGGGISKRRKGPGRQPAVDLDRSEVYAVLHVAC